MIGSCINVDMTLAKMKLTEENADRTLADQYSFGWDTMQNDGKWTLYEGYQLIFIVMKFLFTGLTLSCGVPGGIFTPTFAMGAVIG